MAASTGALKGLRKDKSAEKLLRVLLIHPGCGHSLRETVVRARKAQLAELSSVALWKRLRKSREWRCSGSGGSHWRLTRGSKCARSTRRR